MTTPIAPSIHLNGTAACTLRVQYMEALAAVRAALAPLQASTPNGRDYVARLGQPFGETFFTAVDEHRARVAQLTQIADDLEAIILAIDAQVAERARRASHATFQVPR